MSLRGFIGETGWRGLYRGAFQAARSALIDGKCRVGDRKCWPATGCSPDTMPGAMSVSTRPPPRFPTPNTEPIEVPISGHSTVHSIICLWVTASVCGVLPPKAVPPGLDAILYDDFFLLREARRSEDAR